MKKQTVTTKQIDAIVSRTEFKSQTVHDKTTIVTAKLPNGFVIVESSSCVDPANYDENLGIKICREKIINKIWELEGYKLQDQLYKTHKGKQLEDCTIRELLDLGFLVETTIAQGLTMAQVGQITIKSPEVQ